MHHFNVIYKPHTYEESVKRSQRALRANDFGDNEDILFV